MKIELELREYEYLKESERLSVKSRRLGKEILPLVEGLIQDYKKLEKDYKELQYDNELTNEANIALKSALDCHIPKDRIEKKIEELENQLKDELVQVTYKSEIEYTVRVLKELLEE